MLARPLSFHASLCVSKVYACIRLPAVHSPSIGDKSTLAFQVVKPIFNFMQDLSKLREDLKKIAENLKEKKRQKRQLAQKIRKLKAFKRRKLAKVCIHFLADEIELIAKPLQELKDLQEVIDVNTTEGKAMLKILNTLQDKESQR